MIICGCSIALWGSSNCNNNNSLLIYMYGWKWSQIKNLYKLLTMICFVGVCFYTNLLSWKQSFWKCFLRVLNRFEHKHLQYVYGVKEGRSLFLVIHKWHKCLTVSFQVIRKRIAFLLLTLVSSFVCFMKTYWNTVIKYKTTLLSLPAFVS